MNFAGIILGFRVYRGYIGIMEKKVETTIKGLGYIGVIVGGLLGIIYWGFPKLGVLFGWSP